MPEYARVCQSMQEYARVCQSMPEYARVCQSMPEYATPMTDATPPSAMYFPQGRPLVETEGKTGNIKAALRCVGIGIGPCCKVSKFKQDQE